MKVTLVKKEGESNERLMSRFNKKVQGSRKLLLVRDIRYYSEDAKKPYVRAAAVMRSKYRSAREKSKFY